MMIIFSFKFEINKCFNTDRSFVFQQKLNRVLESLKSFLIMCFNFPSSYRLCLDARWKSRSRTSYEQTACKVSRKLGQN